MMKQENGGTLYIQMKIKEIKMSKPCENCGSDFRVCISCDLYNGKYIEIPDNTTNGDVLISLYPNLKYTIQNGRVVTTIGVASSFDLDWWNAPYQKGE